MSEEITLPVHDIPGGSFKLDPLDAVNKKMWPMDDGINILETPLGSPEFIEGYLKCKGDKHRQLLDLINKMAAPRYPREATAMLT